MRDKIFAVIIFLITILLFIFMPQIRDSLGQRPMFSQEFAVGVVQDVLEEDLTEDPIVTGRY